MYGEAVRMFDRKSYQECLEKLLGHPPQPKAFGQY